MLRLAEAAIVVLGHGDGVQDVCRAVRRDRGGDDPAIVVAGPREALDVPALLAAGATDVWPLAPGGAGDADVRVALAEHYARLQAGSIRLGGELALLRRALDLTGTGFVLTDPRLDDNPIVYANAAFHEMTGYPPQEVLGRNCRFLQGPATEPDRTERLREAIAAGKPATVEIVNHRKDGTPFLNEVHVAPVRDEAGAIVRFVGVQVDVSVYRRQEALYAIERRARREAEEAGRRSTFLADASPVLDASLDLAATLESLVRLSVPQLADLCLVNVVESGEVRRVAFAAADPAAERLLRGLPSVYTVGPPGEDPVVRVMRSGRPEVIDDDAAGVFGDSAGMLGDRVPRAAMLIPLRTRGRTLGVLALGSLDGARRFGEDEVAFAGDVARRAALAVDNARLFEDQSTVARTLQESLLPDRLPFVEGIELAAAYRPAGDGSEIGGDFYDAFPAPSGGTVIAIGDVTGKGAKAAALTGLARHTLRAASAYEETPEALALALNRALVAQRGRRGKYCTVALALLEAHRDGVRARVVCAGHPPPLVLRADGSVEPAGRPGMLLGYIARPRLDETTTVLRPGDALVLYTDGLTEARTSTGLLGDERLAALVRTCSGLGAGAIASRIERAAIDLQGGDPRDDIAIAVARVDDAVLGGSTPDIALADRQSAV